jgi:hypothetical protein
MHSLRFVVLICLAVAASRTLLPAQTTPRAARRPAPHVQPGTGSHNEDREIEAEIRARFARSKIAADKFEVHVQGGVATIEGHTDVIQRKGTATRLAKIAGARQVVNRIELSEAARRRAADNLAQGRRRVQVKRGELRSQGR